MSDIICLELKYCERCGGLLLRRAGLNLNYCKPCQRIERDLPPVTLQRRSARPPVLPLPPACEKRPGSSPDIHACYQGDPA